MTLTAPFQEMSDAPEMEEPSRPQSNLNTILLAICLAVMGFIGHETIETGKKLSAIEAAQVTRPEIEAKLEGLRKDYMDISARISAIERDRRP